MTDSTDILLDGVRERLAATGASAWLPDPSNVTVERLSAGAYHENFRVTSATTTVVARYNRTSQWGLGQSEQLRREFRVLCDLRPSRVAPLPHALLDGRFPLLIESFVEGSPFRYGPDLDQCATSIARAHRCGALQSRPYLPHDRPEHFLLADGAAWLERAERLLGVSTATTLLHRARANLARRGKLPGASEVIVHTDLIHSNLLRTKDGCMIVDWEGARLGPPAWDLAYFLSPVTLQWAPEDCHEVTTDDREHFLRSYASAAGTDAERLGREVAELLPFVIFRALAWCVGFEQTERHVPAVAEQLANFTDPGFIAHHLVDGDRS